VISFTECWARDGIQAEAYVATVAKLRVLGAAAETGADRIEVTSMAKPSAWPQFVDAIEVLHRYRRCPDIEYSVYVPNLRGLTRLLDEGGGSERADVVLVAVAASDGYNVKNTGRGLDAIVPETLDVIRAAARAGLRTVGCVGTAWACPIEGPTSESAVVSLCERMLEAGADELALGDTTGEANPRSVRALVSAVKSEFGCPLSAHFHDARGAALANAFAALDAGVERLEGALGGVGGHPPDQDQPSPSGNLCTEDMAALVLAAGWDLRLRLDAVVTAGAAAQEALGRRLYSHVQSAGVPAVLQSRG